MRKVFARLSSLVSRLQSFANKESMSLWLIILGFSLNVTAWVLPLDDYRHPHRDPTGLIRLISSHITNDRSLTYFWHALLSLTVVSLVLSLYKVASFAAAMLGPRVDP